MVVQWPPCALVTCNAAKHDGLGPRRSRQAVWKLSILACGWTWRRRTRPLNIDRDPGTFG